MASERCLKSSVNSGMGAVSWKRKEMLDLLGLGGGMLLRQVENHSSQRYAAHVRKHYKSISKQRVGRILLCLPQWQRGHCVQTEASLVTLILFADRRVPVDTTFPTRSILIQGKTSLDLCFCGREHGLIDGVPNSLPSTDWPNSDLLSFIKIATWYAFRLCTIISYYTWHPCKHFIIYCWLTFLNPPFVPTIDSYSKHDKLPPIEWHAEGKKQITLDLLSWNPEPWWTPCSTVRISRAVCSRVWTTFLISYKAIKHSEQDSTKSHKATK